MSEYGEEGNSAEMRETDIKLDNSLKSHQTLAGQWTQDMHIGNRHVVQWNLTYRPTQY